MKSFWLAAVSLSVFASPALAQPAEQSPPGNLDRLSAFQSTGTEEPKPIPQEGRKADAIRRNLEKIKLPQGFKIDLYALVPDARHMAVGPNAGVVFVGTRKNHVYAVTDRDKDRIAERTKDYEDRFANPFVAAEKGFIDEVIQPRSTRRRVARAFASLRNKQLTNPWKKHDNIPL